MTPDQLFIKLPRDLQWEVLADFIGTHVVRNGKLRRKIAYFTAQDGSLTRQLTDNTLLPVVNGLRVREHYDWDYHRPENIRWHIRLIGNIQMKFYEDDKSGDTIYGYSILKDDYYPVWELHFPTYKVNVPTLLFPFMKTMYPSYPHTDKKKKQLFLR